MPTSIPQPRRYPEGVPCWVDLEVAEPAVAAEFYAGLFGWNLAVSGPPGPQAYRIATLDDQDAAGIGPGSAGWSSYVCCDDVDAVVARVEASGGSVLEPPDGVGPEGRAGRGATAADPQGAVFRLWQPGYRLGSQVVNVPGAWNFSDLHTPDPEAAIAFYGAVFGWRVDPELGAGMIRLAGYGDHLAATVDPDIHRRQAFAPPGFADVIAGITPDGTGADGKAEWRLRFTVADRDASASLVGRLGGTVLGSTETPWTKEAAVRDPQGGVLTLSQFSPPA